MEPFKITVADERFKPDEPIMVNECWFAPMGRYACHDLVGQLEYMRHLRKGDATALRQSRVRLQALMRGFRPPDFSIYARPPKRSRFGFLRLHAQLGVNHRRAKRVAHPRTDARRKELV